MHWPINAHGLNQPSPYTLNEISSIVTTFSDILLCSKSAINRIIQQSTSTACVLILEEERHFYVACSSSYATTDVLDVRHQVVFPAEPLPRVLGFLQQSPGGVQLGSGLLQDAGAVRQTGRQVLQLLQLPLQSSQVQGQLGVEDPVAHLLHMAEVGVGCWLGYRVYVSFFGKR